MFLNGIHMNFYKFFKQVKQKKKKISKIWMIPIIYIFKRKDKPKVDNGYQMDATLNS